MEWTTQEITPACATQPETVTERFLALRQQVQALREPVQELERQLNQDSSNSHKPAEGSLPTGG